MLCKKPADSAAVNLAGRNVMVFIMESMSAEHSAYLMPEVYAGRETKGFTPFLDSLMRGGLCFKRMYANGTRSIQAMPSVLGSIPSFRTPFVLMPQSLGESRQLPAILRGRGYSTAFFCGSEHGSMGFGAYARSAGVERLVSREDYEDRHGKGDFDGYWGIWDEPFLQFTGEELSRTPEPFFATLFTLSSHHPFVVPAQYEDKLPAGYTKLHKGVAYVDNAFRLFFERFGSEEWFRRTIFVFVADHVSSEKFAAETRSYPGNYHIIGFMYTPDGALRGQVGEVVQQLDIMPTLLGLLGNTESYFAFGRDVLNEPQRQQWSVSWDGAFQAVTNDGTIRFDVVTHGIAAHSARAWMGHNAIHDAAEILRRLNEHTDATVSVDGLVYREGLNATLISGGKGTNVIPDECRVHVNYRFAPDKSLAEAKALMMGADCGAELGNGEMDSKIREVFRLDLGGDSPDNRILKVAFGLQEQGRRVVFISKDINLRLKADAIGLKVMDFERGKVDERALYTGFQEV